MLALLFLTLTKYFRLAIASVIALKYARIVLHAAIASSLVTTRPNAPSLVQPRVLSASDAMRVSGFLVALHFDITN